MKHVTLPDGERVPALGMGTWNMGEHRAARAEEIATLRLGLDLGLRLIDTAEMYGEGLSETLVGEAMAGRRDEVFLVSKVYPHNASRRGIAAACERSLQRLGTDRIDLYLLHWRGSIPLEETLQGLQALQRAGKIRHYGVSNLDLSDMEELWGAPGGDQVAVNQLLYNLGRRGIEWDLLPWLRERRVPVMAYSPIEQARLTRHPKLVWLLARDDIIAIPKTSHRDRLRENFGALAHSLTPEQLAALDRIFPPPSGPRSLEVL